MARQLGQSSKVSGKLIHIGSRNLAQAQILHSPQGNFRQGGGIHKNRLKCAIVAFTSSQHTLSL